MLFSWKQLSCCDTSWALFDGKGTNWVTILFPWSFSGKRNCRELIKSLRNVVSGRINWSDRQLLITFPTHQTSSSLFLLTARFTFFSLRRSLFLELDLKSANEAQKTIPNGRVVKISYWLIRFAVFPHLRDNSNLFSLRSSWNLLLNSAQNNGNNLLRSQSCEKKLF